MIMEKIEPHYVNFNTAKLLKDKGFDNIECSGYYHINEGYEKGYSFCYSKMIEQYNNGILAPEQWQVVEWFFEKYNINIQPYQITNDSEYYPDFFSEINNKGEIIEIGWSKTREEAISKAIDYILNNNLIMKIEKQTVYIPTTGYYDFLVKSHNNDLITHVEGKTGLFFTPEEYNQHIQEIAGNAYNAGKLHKKLALSFDDPKGRYLNSLKLNI
jgi:hypothetical protein